MNRLMDNKGMVFGVAIFLGIILIGILYYIVIYYVWETFYTILFSGLSLTTQGSASLAVLVALWSSIPVIIFFVAAWWLFSHVHRRQSI